MDVVLQAFFGASRINLEWVVVAVAAWFAQMGFHEGAHAFAADRLGDRMPRMMGKCTINPFKHIEWNNSSYVIGAVVVPIVTAMMGWIPMGMAYVMHSRMSTKDEAKIAIAGPIGSFVVALIGFALWVLVYPMVGAGNSSLNHFVHMACLALVVVSIVYAVFNLIPLPPLDGGTVIYHFMNREGRDFLDRIRPYGFFILIAMFWILPRLSGGTLDVGYVFGKLIVYSIQLMESVPKELWGM